MRPAPWLGSDRCASNRGGEEHNPKMAYVLRRCGSETAGGKTAPRRCRRTSPRRRGTAQVLRGRTANRITPEAVERLSIMSARQSYRLKNATGRTFISLPQTKSPVRALHTRSSATGRALRDDFVFYPEDLFAHRLKQGSQPSSLKVGRSKHLSEGSTSMTPAFRRADMQVSIAQSGESMRWKQGSSAVWQVHRKRQDTDPKRCKVTKSRKCLYYSALPNDTIAQRQRPVA